MNQTLLKTIFATVCLLSAWSVQVFGEPGGESPAGENSSADATVLRDRLNSAQALLDSNIAEGVMKSPDLAREYLTHLREMIADLGDRSKGVSAAKLMGTFNIRLGQFMMGMGLIKLASNPKKVWDVQATADFGINVASLGSWVFGISIPGMYVVSGINTVYKIPYVRTKIDEQTFGKYLYGPEDTVSTHHLTDYTMTSKPYLVCSEYRSTADLALGNKARQWGFAQLSDNPEFGAQNNASFSGKKYITVPGRWVKVASNPFQHIVRFATLASKTDLELTCWKMFKRLHHEKSKSKGLEEQAAVEEDEELKFLQVPSVGYTGYTQDYPIYHYIPTTNKDTGERIATLVGEEIAEHGERQMQSDKRDYFSELIRDLNTTRMFINPQLLGWTARFHALYGAYLAYSSYMETGEILPTDELIDLSFETSEGISLASKPLVGNALSVIPLAKTWYRTFIKPTAQYLGIDFSTIRKMFAGMNLDLKQLRSAYVIDAFKAPKTMKAYLACTYPKEGKKDEIKSWEWATAPAGEALEVEGRWVEDGKHTFFATLEDPAKLLAECVKMAGPDLLPYGNTIAGFKQAPKTIVPAVGISNIKTFFPILYYVKGKAIIQKEGGIKGEQDAAVIFAPNLPEETKAKK